MGWGYLRFAEGNCVGGCQEAREFNALKIPRKSKTTPCNIKAFFLFPFNDY